MAERERMMEIINQQEQGASMPSSHSLQGDNSQIVDPAVQQELQAKKQYIEKMRNQIKEIR